MVRFALFLSISCGLVTITFGQKGFPIKPIITPFDSIKEGDYLEKLITIAWESYPKNKSFDSKKAQAQQSVKLARSSWMNNVNMFTSFNSFNNAQSQNFTIVPNLGLGLSLNVGSVYSLPGKIKIAKEEVKITDNELNAQKLYIRAEVIARYNTMRLHLDLLKFQQQAGEEMFMTTTMVKEKFQRGEISIEEYNKAFAAYTVVMERAFTSQANYRTTKASLEELLGTTIENIH